jgi:PAS domain S-box-containing protein
MTTILVVEDEAIVAADIAQRLRRGGFDVPAVAATGEAALRTADEVHPDLVLMDILLKGEKDGIETAREMGGRFEIPVVFLTGQADDATRDRVTNTSAYGLILKPIDPASLLSTVELVLARHAFELQLKDSEERFRAVTDSAAEAIFSIDAQGNVTYWNVAARRIFGWTADDVIGQPVTVLLPESAKAGFFKILSALAARETSETYAPPSLMPFRRKDGTEFPAEPSFASWKTKEGSFATAIVRDITEQKKMKRAIADSEARFRSVVETATDAIIATKASGDIIFWNAAAEEMFGYKAEEALGMPLAWLAPKPMQERVSKALTRFTQRQVPQTRVFESRAQRKDGSQFDAESACALWTAGSERFMTAVVRDVSDRKRTQERLASFTECLLNFGPDPRSNISSLTAFSGHVLAASSAFYVHFGEQDKAWGRWRAPEDWDPEEFSVRQLLFESAHQGTLEPAVIRDLSQSEYAQTDPSVRRYNWQTCIGALVIAAGEPVGALALVFTEDRSPSDEDLRMVEVTTSAMAVEESRWAARQETKQREAQQKEILEAVPAGIILIDPATHKIADVNPTAARLFGAPKDSIIGSVCHQFICPAAVGSCPITDLGKSVDNAERVLLTADGTSRLILKSASKITLEGHAYLLESFIDVVEAKQTD